MTAMTKTKMRLTSMGAGRVGAELPITTAEVFRWVCAKQGISNPERLTDARYRSLWTIADRAMDSINRLFAVSNTPPDYFKADYAGGVFLGND